ncbi:hypothetical protein E2562_005977 [Oryza meyeriana var. granulata]|uniref:Uncharacterized protein n=1 Tax=Oryza meyeriana var. granulata TaxID=110450 RepID=A0A6G1DW95_9ORYZ|nr:hypothetical protein E2562_005977 [Oryza meyeriana var. granulata]
MAARALELRRGGGGGQEVAVRASGVEEALLWSSSIANSQPQCRRRWPDRGGNVDSPLQSSRIAEQAKVEDGGRVDGVTACHRGLRIDKH